MQSVIRIIYSSHYRREFPVQVRDFLFGSFLLPLGDDTTMAANYNFFRLSLSAFNAAPINATPFKRIDKFKQIASMINPFSSSRPNVTGRSKVGVLLPPPPSFIGVTRVTDDLITAIDFSIDWPWWRRNKETPRWNWKTGKCQMFWTCSRCKLARICLVFARGIHVPQRPFRQTTTIH